MKKFWHIISHIGIDPDLPEFELKSAIFTNRINAIIWLFVLSSIVINILLNTYFFVPPLSIVLMALSMNYMLSLNKLFIFAKISLLLTVLFLLTYMLFKGAAGSGIEFYFLSLLTVPMMIFRKKWLIYLFQFLCLLTLTLQKLFVKPLSIAETETIVFTVFFIVNSCYSGLLIILAVTFFQNITKHSENLLINKNKIIEEKNAQLEATNKGLDTFTYSVSHDLQAPLRAIAGFSELVNADYHDKLDEEGQKMLDLIKKNAVKMKDLIDDLLRLSRSEKKEMELESVNMGELAKNAVNELKVQIEQCKIKVTIQSLPNARVDLSLMMQAFVNLLSNAVKYSSKQASPQIEIGALKEKGQLVFFIRDNGIGFDMKYSEKIFQVFQRLNSNQEYEGTGIGLSIVERIIKRHGGKIWSKSAPNEGATFFFTLSKDS